ncbi:MAG: peroxiredoxin-like family protein [Chitinophagales bacterium]
MKTLTNLLLILLIFTHSISQAQEKYKTVEETNGIQVGASVSDFEATDQNGEIFRLKETLEEKPVVVIFYRGQWCPICSRHLSNLQDSLSFINEMGAEVIAISPEKQEYLKKTQEKSNATFTLLYDKDYKISKMFDVLFRPEEKTTSAYNRRLGANLTEAHSDESQRLPVPATFVINQQGEVVWRHFDRNYKERASVASIVSALEKL